MTPLINQVADGIYIINDFFKESDIVDKLIDQCDFDEFTINNKVLCRTGSFQGDQLEHDRQLPMH
jgi:hypothetical protein